MTTAILSALPEEQSGLLGYLEKPQRLVHAGRTFWRGDLHGKPVVLALSGIGKVAAATTAAALVERFGVARIVFTGVAGGVAKACAWVMWWWRTTMCSTTWTLRPCSSAGWCRATRACVCPAMRGCLLIFRELLTHVW